ncbi:DegT/DnrJ/EryC1/StrS family aminotransferase [Streptomyces sp. SID3343]|uniref:DegT/DnrJ/EryC1/StrS family aminotransferase n=1 Tax=Streptomyces sp. SID3343 TaxID=2690260 RepID=UPI00136D8FDA|nr:DegT/DnrJ/EryC1/StrS family aminotransferase [Streptomyces sp. SID3343]MYW03222.1 aminotransferase class I/II-fold pyridoxal phosphate-dependent enzyme [Streptomyces sp. SID3343]
MRKIPYAGSVHDQSEIDAILTVLNGPPAAMGIGRNVAAMETRVAELFGKRQGLMCNSGSSALYLAIELLRLSPGDEIITSTLTFSTDIAPMVKAGIVPVLADVEPDTYQIDVNRIEALIGPRTKAIMTPNLAGNAPDWDAIRAIADRHGLKVIEDSCDALGATLRGTPTGTRADISVTSFAMSHIITCAGNGGMVLTDDEDLRDRGLMLRRWGRRSELQLFGSKKGNRDFFEEIDGVLYDNLFIFDEIGWNFEPSELGAAFGLAQLDKLPRFLATRQEHFAAHHAYFDARPEFTAPRQTEDLVTGWLNFPILLNEGLSFSRGEMQAWLEERGVSTRTVWSGNILRQPGFKDIAHRADPAGYPNADRVMERALIVPMNHRMAADDVAYIHEQVDAFLASR